MIAACGPGRWSAACLALLVLSACGFHLRGTTTLSPLLERPYIDAEAPYAGVAAALRRELRLLGAEIARRPGHATGVLRILDEYSGRRVLSVATSGRVREYELIESVRFELRDRGGRVVLEPTELSLVRDYVFDEKRLLGKEAEAQDLRRQMRADLARQIISRVAVRRDAP